MEENVYEQKERLATTKLKKMYFVVFSGIK